MTKLLQSQQEYSCELSAKNLLETIVVQWYYYFNEKMQRELKI